MKCLNPRQNLIIIKMHNNETFQQLKSLNFVIIISVLTKRINIVLIKEYIKSKSYHRTWQKTTH